MDLNFEQILNGIEALSGHELTYVSGRNKVKVVRVERDAQRILLLRGSDNISISLERFELVIKELSKGKLIDINEVLKAGGNERSAIEAIIAHLPNVGYYNGSTQYNKTPQKKIAWFNQEIHALGELKDMSETPHIFGDTRKLVVTQLSKPFILLAGISGTGKTRFVREQAKAHRDDLSNYCLIPVRPDWREPSDLLGYVSRIGTPRYVVTELLSFVVKAWKEAAQSATVDASVTKPVTAMTPYWLCLDEMNLAPVEQYFADYLSVLESREWTADGYRCLPLLKAELFNKDEEITNRLRADLGLINTDSEDYDGLWNYFKTVGIPLPPNLIVAGTVNMDETTHGFSRKVIDRAFTIDFGAFFPNDFSHYFVSTTRNKTLSFPALSRVEQNDLSIVTADPDGSKSIAFLNEINSILKNTPFELAFRALNELLISLVCFKPKDDAELQAVWDDFLMTKVLPRIDGDTEKLRSKTGAINLLEDLSEVATKQLSAIWDSQRPDLLREESDGTLLNIDCHSKKKMAWMSKRLSDNGFTSFWP